MIIVKIQCGLGNQMFQYSYAKALEKNGFNVKLDINNFYIHKLHGGYSLDKYNIDLKLASKEEIEKFYKNNKFSKAFNKLITRKIIKEKSLSFDTKIQNIKDSKYVYGYFQTEKYFLHIRDILLTQFIMNFEYSNYTKNIAKQILNYKISCSLHIRRGDYLSDEKTNKIHGLCDLEYYKKAMKFLNERYENIQYIIFSDDIAWSKQNLIVDNILYIDSQEKRKPQEDIYLMSLCKHNITANSTFSWWGAWLNQNNNKIVISPKIWFADNKKNKFNDIVSSKWKRM